jgi:signal transduction histidine kinase
MGIPEEEKEKMFAKFFRASNAKEKENDGTGLGLYFIKEVIERMGGEIWFDSKINEGTKFFFKIPKA